jgi:hypothetical protein
LGAGWGQHPSLAQVVAPPRTGLWRAPQKVNDVSTLKKKWEEVFFWAAALAIFIFSGGVLIFATHFRWA